MAPHPGMRSVRIGVMVNTREEYLLSRAPDEVARLQSWTQSWVSETEAVLDCIRIQPGWRCLDLACGPAGILEPLRRRAGPEGQVIGADINPAMLAAARDLCSQNRLDNVHFLLTDSYQSGLQRESFDLVHARFVLSPLGQEDRLLQEMIALARPGGIILSQESDEAGYVCYPPQPAWDRLKQLTMAAFTHGGGDYSAGRRTYRLLRRAGLENVQARAAMLALPAAHPFRIWPIESAAALRGRMLEWGLIAEAELNGLFAECERIAHDPDIFLTSFSVIQVWGSKPRNVRKEMQ